MPTNCTKKNIAQKRSLANDIKTIVTIEEFLDYDLKLIGAPQSTIDLITKIDEKIRRQLSRHKKIQQETDQISQNTVKFIYFHIIYSYRFLWQSDPVASKYFKFKANKGLVFYINPYGELLKISKHMKGPSSSIIYLSETDDNDERIKIRMDGRKLGSGSYGSVKSASIYGTQEEVAIKKCLLPRNKEARKLKIEGIKEEANNHRDLGLTVKTTELQVPGYKHYLAMRLVPGVDGCKAMQATNGEPLELLKILYSMALAINELHAKGFIHRDIKPQNIVCRKHKLPAGGTFSSTYISELVDLQWVKKVDHSSGSVKESVILGTTGFLEKQDMKDGKYEYSKKTDLYAFAVICECAYRLFHQHYQGQSISDKDRTVITLIINTITHYMNPAPQRDENLASFLRDAGILLNSIYHAHDDANTQAAPACTVAPNIERNSPQPHMA